MCIGLIVLCLGAHIEQWDSLGTFRVRVLLLWTGGQLQFLDQVLGCSAGMAWSTGLHKGYAGYYRHRHRHRGNFGDSWCLWFWSCRCNGWRLQQLCRLSRCRQWCRNMRSGRSLQCGCCDIWGSVSGLDTAFMKVSSHVVVDHTITGVHLVAVFWQGTFRSGRDPDLAESVIHHNGLASIQGCKRSAAFVCLWLGGIRVALNSFTNLEGCQISVANSGRNGGPNLVLVQELSRWWELGINGCSSECQNGMLWVGTAVFSALEHMLHGFYTCLCKFIWLQVVRA